MQHPEHLERVEALVLGAPNNDRAMLERMIWSLIVLASSPCPREAMAKRTVCSQDLRNGVSDSLPWLPWLQSGVVEVEFLPPKEDAIPH